MWKVKCGEEDVAQAQEAFGAICVTAAEADKVLAAAGLPFEAEKVLPSTRGNLGQGELYGLDELVRLNKIGKCAVSRPDRTYTVPGPVA